MHAQKISLRLTQKSCQNINTKIAKVKIIASVAITSYRWSPLVIVFLTTAL
jgi:hypothetical protein